MNTLTTKEVARNFKVETETVRRWIREGRLKARRINGHYLILEKDMTNFFLGRQANEYGVTPEQLKTFLEAEEKKQIDEKEKERKKEIDGFCKSLGLENLDIIIPENIGVSSIINEYNKK